MKRHYFDDHSHIAESFAIIEDHTSRLAFLAYHKIHAYKLSLSSESFCVSRQELAELITTTLFNYVHPCTILQTADYYNNSNDN
ncbi:hypothetical protein ESA94_00325 [Lacibacter luteus]|uniref:Uncharacterized protein n=1 Tax=Lacibacter luteus TaxID=2508719 RepID=A0A4Q1CKQ9_9BACT|nr:hypothetical protein [Lacibacter luteus]RXK61500.1 hypothetical protein ESA94_00325 [Lacibacter luteus]